MSGMEAAITVSIISLVTLFTRAAPFFLFPDAKKAPPFVRYLGRVLPHAMMGMLVVYCLKGVNLSAAPFGLPEGIAILTAAVLYVWRRSMMLSIACATAMYMILLRVMFV